MFPRYLKALNIWVGWICRLLPIKVVFFAGFGLAGLGGGWYYGLNAGAFYWIVNNSSTNRNRNIGSRAVNALTN